MKIPLKSLHDLNREVMEILCTQIGLANTVRFFNQFSTGEGNYTEEREQLFGHLTLEEIVSDIEQMRNQGVFS